MATVEKTANGERLTRLEATLEEQRRHLATKEDLQKAINALTWRLILLQVALAGALFAGLRLTAG